MSAGITVRPIPGDAALSLRAWDERRAAPGLKGFYGPRGGKGGAEGTFIETNGT